MCTFIASASKEIYSWDISVQTFMHGKKMKEAHWISRSGNITLAIPKESTHVISSIECGLFNEVKILH